jgi:hypothetical protein
VDAALPEVESGLLTEARLFHVLAMSDEGRRRMQAYLDAGGQTRDGELSNGQSFLLP